LVVVAAVVPAVLLIALPLASLLNLSIYSDTFGLIPVLRLSTLVSSVSEAKRLLVVGGIVAAAVFVLWPRKAWPQFVFPVAVGAFLVLSSYPTVGTLRDYSRNLKTAAGLQQQASWLDTRLGRGGQASFLLGTTSDTFTEATELWEQEFWNRSLGPVYNLSTPEPAGGPETAVKVKPQTGLIVAAATGRPLRLPFVVTGSSYAIAGHLVAAQAPFALYRTRGPLRVAQTVSGVYGDGWMGSDAAFTRYVTKGRGQLSVFLTRAAWGGPDVPGHARIQVIPLRAPNAGRATATQNWTLHSRRGHRFTLPTPNGPYTVTVHIDPTFSPSQFGQPDTRQLGAQVYFKPR
jgi:hypothetical protein